MSMISAICAEAHLGIVTRAIAKAKKSARAQFTTDEYAIVVSILDQVLHECEGKISE